MGLVEWEGLGGYPMPNPALVSLINVTLDYRHERDKKTQPNFGANHTLHGLSLASELSQTFRIKTIFLQGRIGKENTIFLRCTSFVPIVRQFQGGVQTRSGKCRSENRFENASANLSEISDPIFCTQKK